MSNPFAIYWIKSRLSQSESRPVSSASLFLSNLWLFDMVFIVLIALVLLHGRWSSIVYPLPLNPDEAQNAANAMRMHAYGFNWNVVDGATNGPLDSLILCWPYLFGLDPTLNTGRLVAWALLFFICVYVYLSAKTICGRVPAVLLVLPLVVFYSLTDNPNFVHYSSELLPLFLLLAAHYLIVKVSVERDGSPRREAIRYFLIGLLLGAVPFAKLQAAPIAVVAAFYPMILALIGPRQTRWRNAILLSCGGIATCCAFLLPLVASGHIRDFWNSYIAWAFLYDKLNDYAPSARKALSIVGIQSMISDDLLMACFSGFILLLTLLVLLHASLVARSGATAARATKYGAIYSLALVVAALWVIAQPGRADKPFDHYLMFYPPLVVVFCSYVVRTFIDRRADVLIFTAYYSFLAVSLIGTFFADVGPRHKSTGAGEWPRMAFEARSPHILSWLPIPEKHLLIWGWMSQWYLWSGITPAARETNTYAEIDDTSLQGYFRGRFMSDVTASSPDVIWDAVEGRSFVFNRADQGPGIFPEFSAYLSSNYTQLTPWQPHDGCPKLYVRNEYKAVIDRRLVLPASVTTSADFLGEKSPFNGANLFDDSVTEDSCIDYWLLPTRTLGSVDVRFQKIEPVSRLMILNTRNGGYLDRATDRIDVKLLKSGAVVGDRQLAMQPYPYWTSIDLDTPMQADELQVSILSYFGRGGGLNEIKIFRPDESVAGDPGTASHHP